LFIAPVGKWINNYLRIDNILAGRDQLLEATFDVISNNLIFGAGPAATKYEMYKYLPVMLGSPQEFLFFRHFESIQFGHAHNFYLFYFSDLGLFGLLAAIIFPLIFLSISSKTLHKVKREENSFYFLVVGIQAAGLAIFARGIFEWGGILSYGAISGDLPFWWIFSILIYLYQRN
jgi:O-antigen ligase